MVGTSSVSDKTSSPMARKSKTRCSHGKNNCLFDAACVAQQSPLSSLSFSSLFFNLSTQLTERKYGCFLVLCQAVVTNSVCLCSSDCESREVLTLLCQGKMWAQICTHSNSKSTFKVITLQPPLTLFHLLSPELRLFVLHTLM